MIRASAKNHKYVVVVVNPQYYPELADEMEKNGGAVSRDFAFRCALEVYRTTARYDSLIASYFAGKIKKEGLPERLDINLDKVCDVRYGENPHQPGAFYRCAGQPQRGLAAAEVLQGKELSFNNYLDLESVLSGVREFEGPAAYIVKHTSPCGVASHKDLAEAYRLALECDPLSAFGGIVDSTARLTGKPRMRSWPAWKNTGFWNACWHRVSALRHRKNLR